VLKGELSPEGVRRMSTQHLVERALKELPITRGSDRHLIVAVWHYQDPQWRLDPAKWILGKAIMPETITRHRRKLQEQGLYLPDEKVTEARYSKFKEMRQGNLAVL
jgi:hypothetical protein